MNLSPKAEVAKKPPKQTRITDWKSNPDIDEPMKYNAEFTEDRTKVTKVEVLEVRDGFGFGEDSDILLLHEVELLGVGLVEARKEEMQVESIVLVQSKVIWDLSFEGVTIPEIVEP